MCIVPVFDPLDPFRLVHRPAIGTFYTFGLRTKSSLSVLVVANMRCNIRYIKRIVNFVGFSTKIFHSAAGDTQLIHLYDSILENERLTDVFFFRDFSEKYEL